jgi:chromosome partitioning protein
MGVGCETISLLNMKGGVGKTTLAVNLAWHTYRHGQKRVLLIDFDPQFNASQYLMDFTTYEEHVKKRGTIADLLIDSPDLRLRGKRKPPSIKKCIARIEQDKNDEEHYLDFLPSQLALAHVVKNPAQMDYKLEKLLSQVREDYDYVFIDCAPTDSVLTTMGLTASNFVLVPIRPDRFSILGFGNLRSTINEFRDKSSDPNNVRELGVVFTQVRTGQGVEYECMESVRAQASKAKSYVFSSSLDFSNTFIRAIQNQTPAFETKFARDELKQNIADIVSEMESRIATLKSKKGGK